MYDHLTFPEYVITILTKSVQDFESGYMERFRRYPAFKTTFPDFDSFISFYSSMLEQAKERSVGSITLKIEPKCKTLNRGFTAYNFYDESHVYPILNMEIQQIGKAITIGMSPI